MCIIQIIEVALCKYEIWYCSLRKEYGLKVLLEQSSETRSFT